MRIERNAYSQNTVSQLADDRADLAINSGSALNDEVRDILTQLGKEFVRIYLGAVVLLKGRNLGVRQVLRLVFQHQALLLFGHFSKVTFNCVRLKANLAGNLRLFSGQDFSFRLPDDNSFTYAAICLLKLKVKLLVKINQLVKVKANIFLLEVNDGHGLAIQGYAVLVSNLGKVFKNLSAFAFTAILGINSKHFKGKLIRVTHAVLNTALPLKQYLVRANSYTRAILLKCAVLGATLVCVSAWVVKGQHCVARINKAIRSWVTQGIAFRCFHFKRRLFGLFCSFCWCGWLLLCSCSCSPTFGSSQLALQLGYFRNKRLSFVFVKFNIKFVFQILKLFPDFFNASLFNFWLLSLLNWRPTLKIIKTFTNLAHASFLLWSFLQAGFNNLTY